MYAIRSYYAAELDHEEVIVVHVHVPRGVVREGVQAPFADVEQRAPTRDLEGAPRRRITSYNVCYTKLLRAVTQPPIPGTVLLFTSETLRFQSDHADGVDRVRHPGGVVAALRVTGAIAPREPEGP